MDALRQNVNSAERSLKAATYRHAQATSKLTSVNKALKVAVAEVENAAGSDAIAVAKAQKAAARVTRKAAEKALAEAEGELEDRTAEAEVAKDAYNEHKSSRPRRINPRDKYEEPTAPPEYNEIVETAQPINETTIATFLAETKSAFADIPAMSIFPEPPAALCAKPSCARGKNNRALAACACNIREVLSGIQDRNLKPRGTASIPTVSQGATMTSALISRVRPERFTLLSTACSSSWPRILSPRVRRI